MKVDICLKLEKLNCIFVIALLWIDMLKKMKIYVVIVFEMRKSSYVELWHMKSHMV